MGGCGRAGVDELREHGEEEEGGLGVEEVDEQAVEVDPLQGALRPRRRGGGGELGRGGGAIPSPSQRR